MRTLVEKMAKRDNIEIEDLAAALAWQLQRRKPLHPKLKPLDPPSTRQRVRPPAQERFGSTSSAGGAMTGYRISVGREQQITPRDIVGAFTNEAQLPIRSIGRIKIEAQSSYIELSSNLPPQALAKLGRLQIRHNHIGLKPESTPPAERGKFGEKRKPARKDEYKAGAKKWDKKNKRKK